MQEPTVARNYAEALFELAEADGELALYEELLGQIADLVTSEDDFRLFLQTPLIDPSAKKEVLRAVFEGHLPDRLLRFLLIVVDKRRTRVLPEIAEEFTRLVNEHFGRLQEDITMASQPDEALKKNLRRRLGQILNREILPRYRIDPRIIGGVIVRVGDRIMDGSVRHRLHMLRRRMLEAELG
jgi:F-type H+-transporting ATPase subunit delta